MKRWFERQPKRQPKVFPTGVVELCNPPGAVMDVVFIHDIFEPRDTAWPSTTDPNDTWIKDLLQGEHTDTKARILAFGYDASHVRSLDDLLSIDFLVSCARELLYWYPFVPPPHQPNQGADGQDAIEPSVGEQALPTGRNEPTDRNAPAKANTPIERIAVQPIRGLQITTPVSRSRPTVFVCHGFGGLIYQQAMNLAYEPMLDKGEETEPNNYEEGKPSENKEGKRPVRSRKIRPDTKRKPGPVKRPDDRIQTAFLFNTPHYPPGFTSWVLLSSWKLNIPTPSKTSKKDWSPGTPYHDRNDDFERMQRLFRRVTREIVPRSRRAFAAERVVPKTGLRMSPDHISLPEDHMIATIGNNHFSMTQSTVDEDPSKVYDDFENNVYRYTSVNLCEWAEIFIEKSSDIGAFVAQTIETIEALLSMVTSSDDPSSYHVFDKGTHILKILQVLQDNPVTRSRIIQWHSRNEYQSKNNALREALQDFQSGITHAVDAAHDPEQRLAVLLQHTSLKKLDKELDAIAPYLEWALNFFDWRTIKGDTDPYPNHPFSVIRHHLDQFKHRGSLENML